MKNKIILNVFIIAGLIACSNSNDSNDPFTVIDTPTAFTYSPVKTTFDNKCATCHTSGKSNSSDWLYNPANYETSIKALISKIYSSTNSLTAKMAVAQYGNLTQTEVDAIKTWYAAGYPASGSAPVVTTPTAFTYSPVKTTFDNKCATCHTSGKSNSSDWLYNPANYETSIKALISKIYSSTNSLTAKMAVAQYGNLTQTEVDAIKTWYAAGYPAVN